MEVHGFKGLYRLHGTVCVVKRMSEIKPKPLNPIHRPKWKPRRRFNRDLQIRKLRQLVKEINDRDKYGLDKDELRFRRVGSRRLWEFVLPEGSRVVNGIVFVDTDGSGKVECLGSINQYIGNIGGK